MLFLRSVAILALLLVGCGSAAAVTIIRYTDIFSETYDREIVDWPEGSTLSLPLFDATLGTLKRVWINLAGHVDGDAGFENRSSAGATITTNLAATLTLARPSGPTIIEVVPLASTSEAVARYDGKADFSGPSGRTYTGMSNDTAKDVWLVAPLDLTMFTATPGNTTITLPITAVGASIATGSGSMTWYFDTFASARADVMYEYEMDIPEPVTTFLAGTGLLMIALFSRRRRNT